MLSAVAEFDARPGRVRDALAASRRDWLRLCETTIAEAISLGEIAPDDEPDLAFELDAIARTATQDALLFGESAPDNRARRIRAARLDAATHRPASAT